MSKPLIEVTGFKELQDKIKLIADDKTKRAEVLKILRVVARPTVQAARNLAPRSKKPHTISGKRTRQIIQPGNLSKSIGPITSKSENPTILVGPRVKGKFNAFYGAFVESGRKIQGKNGGKTIGKFYMRKSFELTKGAVTADAETKVAAYIQKQINRLSS
jgi:hypothetical protein